MQRKPLTFSAVFATPNYKLVMPRSTGWVDLSIGRVLVTLELGRVVEAWDVDGFELNPADVVKALDQGAQKEAA